MESNSYLISPDDQYRQELHLLLTRAEIDDLHQCLVDAERELEFFPDVAKDLRAELWYMLLEVREFNAYLKEGGKP